MSTPIVIRCVTLFCRQCCQSFETTRIVAVCPLCARSDHPTRKLELEDQRLRFVGGRS